MDLESTIQTASDILAPLAIETSRPVLRRLDVRIQAEDLLKAIQALQDVGWGYLVAITGMDHPAPVDAGGQPEGEGSLEVLYTIGHGPACVFLRVSVPYSDPRVPTVCSLIPSATVYERELMELFGVEVTGTPDTRRLIVADDFPQGVYPMRKSYVDPRTLRINSEGTQV